jgi:hypothetical protein
MRLAPIACGLLVVVGCARTPRVNVDPETGNVDVDMERAGTGETWNANLRGMGTMPTLSGTATAHVANDMTHAMVSLNGALAGGSHPWHIHEGMCGDNGPIVGPADAYPLLRPGSDGRASAQASLTGLQLNEAKNYYVNVHASPSDLGTIIACGPLDD